MIVSISQFAPDIYRQLRAFLSVRPLPQVPHWEGLARQFYERGALWEAFYVFDRMAACYGKDIARVALERFTHLPLYLRGRGIPVEFRPQTHVAVPILRDGTLPLVHPNRVLIRSGANVLAVSPNCATSRAFHVFDTKPTQTGFAGMGWRTPIQWASIGTGIVYSDDRTKLRFIDLSLIDESIPLELANQLPIQSAYMEFDLPIRRMVGPLEDGTLFITHASPIPVLSDVCRMVRIDVEKCRRYCMHHPMEIDVDLRAIDAVRWDSILPNTEQTLVNDCVSCGASFLTCRGGMQNCEIRFIDSNGGWHTKFVHESPVMAVISTQDGAVSIDETGRAFLFKGDKPIDDCVFALDKLPGILREDFQNCLLSLDWHHKRLYVSKRMTSGAIEGDLSQLPHACVDSNQLCDSYIFHILPHMALLEDGTLHFWNDVTHSIDPMWQVSKSTASVEDWKDLLSSNGPRIEDDPRIRLYVDEM